MEEIRRKEWRDENNVCRRWIQMVKKSCKKCLFDALCSYEDMKNEQDRWTNGDNE